MDHRNNHWTPEAINAVSGAVAGFVSGVVVCPLDVIKTKLQVQGYTKMSGYHGVRGTLEQILKEDGVRGLYRGVGPLILGYLPTWAIYFSVYGRIRQSAPVEPALTRDVLAAVTAGATSTIITNPIWVIKTRLMSQSKKTSWQYTGIVDACRQMYREEGIRVFYSGLTSALIGLPHVAIQFPVYEYLKQKFNAKDHWQGYLGASVLSKCVASTITYPHEVIRSRDQIKSSKKYKGVIKTSVVIFREEGWRAFYAGLGTNICRAVPASAITLFTYEVVSSHLRSRLGAD